MKSRLFVFLSVIVLGSVFVVAGWTTTGEAAAPSQTETGHVFVLRGKINRQHITMRLTREGGKITGTYRYLRIGKDIPVDGTIDADGKVVLREFGAGGNRPTGWFKGTWESSDNSPGISFYGDWSKTETTQNTLYFYAGEDVPDSSLNIGPVAIQQTFRRPKLTVDVTYPRITGSINPNAEKFNRLMRSEMTKMVADFENEIGNDADVPRGLNNGNSFDVGYTVMFANDDLISVSFTVSPYYAGAAHPMHGIQVYNYNLKEGRLIALDELFTPAAYYLDVISRYCTEDLLARLEPDQQGGMGSDPDWVRNGAAANPDNYQNWNITRKGLLISFAPYEVASYADGPQYVNIPFSKLKSILNPAGPVAEF